MFVMGDEVRRTQQGNNNAYCQDNEISWFDWDLVDANGRLFDFVARLLRFRRSSPFYRDERFWAHPGGADITWHGVELHRPDWGDSSHSLAFELVHADDPNTHLYVVFNAYWEPLEFELPPAGHPLLGCGRGHRRPPSGRRAAHAAPVARRHGASSSVPVPSPSSARSSVRPQLRTRLQPCRKHQGDDRAFRLAGSSD